MSTLSFSTHCAFNHIYVFQSLRTGDLRCAENLYYDYLKPLSSELKFELDFFPTKSRKDFLEKLDLIRIEIELKHRPLIHIDMHGDTDKGIEINPTEEFVSWRQFKTKCQQINQACRNNLAVVLASCFGFNAITEVSIKEISPFYLLVGSEELVPAGFIDDQFKQFYKLVFERSCIDTAMESVSKYYKLYLCDKLFVIAFAKYLLEGCMGKGRKERIEQLLTQHVTFSGYGTNNITSVRNTLKKHARPDELTFARYRDKFLMVMDDNNQSRFQLCFDDIVDFLLEEIKTD